MARVKQPDWDKIMDESTMIHALNWFNLNRTTKFAKKEFVSYLKDNKLCDVKYLKKDFLVIATDGFVASLLRQGYTIPAKSMVYFDRSVKQHVHDLIERHESSKPKKNGNGKNGDLDWTLGLVEHEVDRFFDNWESDFEPSAFLVGNKIGPNKARQYAKFYQKSLDELLESFEGKSKDLKEGYSFAGKRYLNKYKKFLEKIIKEFTEYSVRNRKPRRKKSISSNGGSVTQASLETHIRKL